MRAWRRFRPVVLALAIPACAAIAGVSVQAAAFGHARKESLVTTQALRELVRYHVMRGTESFAGRKVRSSCVQGWFAMGHHRKLLHGAIVLLGNGERLYDVGHGVRRLSRRGRSRPADLPDRVRFVLAACPRYLTDRLGTDLVHGKTVEMVDRRTDGTLVAAIGVGSARTRLTLDVAPVSYRPIGLSLVYGRFSGSTDLKPGGGGAEVWRVRHAFHLPLHTGHEHG